MPKISKVTSIDLVLLTLHLIHLFPSPEQLHHLNRTYHIRLIMRSVVCNTTKTNSTFLKKSSGFKFS